MLLGTGPHDHGVTRYDMIGAITMRHASWFYAFCILGTDHMRVDVASWFPWFPEP